MKRRVTWWLYLDMDAFYAEVERRDHPEWRGRPVIVGGSPAGPDRGVVASASYEARRRGIRAGMPMWYARRLCPDGIFVRPRFARYTEASLEIVAYLRRFSPEVHVLSIDECLVNLTDVHTSRGHPRTLADAIRQTIARQLHLPCTVGLARTMLVARVAGKCAKPQGLFWIPHGREPEFLAPLPVDVLPGIGPRTRARLGLLGIWRIGQILTTAPDRLHAVIGTRWWVLPLMARGEDPPRATPPVPWPKSMSRTVTPPVSVAETRIFWGILHWLVEEVTWRMRRAGLVARSVTVRWQYTDMTVCIWQSPLPWPTALGRALYPWLRTCLAPRVACPPPIRQIGVAFDDLAPLCLPPILLAPMRAHLHRWTQVQRAVDRLRQRYGFFTVLSGDMARWLLKHREFQSELSPLAHWALDHRCPASGTGDRRRKADIP